MAIQYAQNPPEGHTQWVWYEGTDTLYTGYALCFNADYGTVTTGDGARLYRVEKPSMSNYRAFAGVVHPAYHGYHKGPGRIRIVLPGAFTRVWTNQSCTCGETRLTFVPGQYYFAYAGFPGAGSALALQTVDRSETAGTCYAVLDAGVQSCGMNIATESGAITTGGVTRIDNTGSSALALTLGSGANYGEHKLIVLRTATSYGATVTVASHAAGASTGFSFTAVNDSLELVWTGAQWQNVGTHTATQV